MLPTLDKATQDALNSLTYKPTGRNYAYEHEILWYGVDAIAHTHLMRRASSMPQGENSLAEFIDKYELKFYDDDFLEHEKGIAVPLKKIEADGIFIPQAAYMGIHWDGIVTLFFSDYWHRVQYDSWKDKRYGYRLMDRTWTAPDLKNPELVERGIRFGADMWKSCVEGFNYTKGGTLETSSFKNGVRKEVYSKPQLKKVTRLAEKLIEYYSAIIAVETEGILIP